MSIDPRLTPGRSSPRATARRLAAALALAALVPVILVCGIWLGGHPEHLPGSVRDALVGDGEAQTLDGALDLIQRDYYRPVKRGRLFDQSLTGLLGSLKDQFSNYFDPKTYKQFQESSNGSFSGVGMNVAEDRRGLKVINVFAGSPAAGAGIHPGDVVVAVDGSSIAGKSSTASTALIKGRSGTRVSLTVLSGGKRRVARVVREQIDVPSVTSKVKRAGGIPVADVAISGFTSGVHGEARQAIDRRLKAGAKGIVLDLRGNGGGLLQEAVLVSSIFIPEGTVVTTKARSRGRRTYSAAGDAIAARIPVVVLVDEGTASSSEIVSGALQDRKRATIVGTRTFGKGVFQEIVPLANGGALELTVGEYFTPNGRNLGGGGVRRGAGIRPDVRARDLPRTRADEALNTALRILAAKLKR